MEALCADPPPVGVPWKPDEAWLWDGKTVSECPVSAEDNLSRISNLYARHLVHAHPVRVANFKTFIKHADLSSPEQWFPAARQLHRRVVFHFGPTNSGKSHAALQSLSSYRSGVYCSPLRLLALEQYENLREKLGLKCSLVTGEERILVQEADFVSCTVEMIDLRTPVECVVIDEIQMIADESRGFAWTRAFLGAIAPVIHICGEQRALPIIEELCRRCGDSLEVVEHHRKSSLRMDSQHVGTFENIRQGDCLVAFSRKDIYRLKQAVEKFASLRCAVVYGSLPPSSRKSQAKLFNSGNEEAQVLVASDAVAFGLNLNIGRIVFSVMEKYDGKTTTPLSAPLTRQIAGRAGRFGSRYPDGLVTCLRRADMPALRRNLGEPAEDIMAAGLLPEFDQLFAFQASLQMKWPFSELLRKFGEVAMLDGPYFLCDSSEMMEKADLIEDLDLDLFDRYLFTISPVDVKSPFLCRTFVEFARAHALGEVACVPHFEEGPVPTHHLALSEYEQLHRALDLYLWLSYRFRETLPDHDEAIARRDECAQVINMGIENITRDTIGASGEEWRPLHHRGKKQRARSTPKRREGGRFPRQRRTLRA